MRWRAICAAGRGSVSPRDSRRLGLCGRTKHGRPSRRSAARRARCHSTGLGGRAVCLSVLVLFLESNSDLGARTSVPTHRLRLSLQNAKAASVQVREVLQSAPKCSKQKHQRAKCSQIKCGAARRAGRRGARSAPRPRGRVACVCAVCGQWRGRARIRDVPGPGAVRARPTKSQF